MHDCQLGVHIYGKHQGDKCSLVYVYNTLDALHMGQQTEENAERRRERKTKNIILHASEKS